jgi:predicted DCC family thiol-disulfide oxidoreductase YuxK
MSETQFTILVDGECPLCARESALLRRLDGGRERLQIVDISAPDFDPSQVGGSLEALMARIHGVMPDGTLIEGVEVFRQAYAAVGRGWLLAWTRLPGLRVLADAGYEWFARNRLRLTGRADVCTTDPCQPRAVPRPAARLAEGIVTSEGTILKHVSLRPGAFRPDGVADE